ncbi:hypothetical protein ELH94_14820 [Rhizobium leguminosarum]|uniref:hypothetical protein n=1 Tax=Rhizobium leguminosarum TaxID=384 RepID=UPI00102F3707|nr:hypothetical protein [Rhizobium leguminosarum]TAX97699.1 hypothetical protein ELH94_14820 [Rhizobium leguminosarum]
MADGAWKAYENWSDYFPTEGRVFSPNHPQGLSDAYFAFDVTEASDLTQRDRFRLQTLRRAEEVLDYSDRDPEDVRRIFVEEGLSGRKPDRETVVVVLPDDLCVRVSLVRDASEKKSIAELIDLAELPLYAFDRSLFAGDKIDGCWYVVPNVTVGPQQGTIDWSLDKDFLASLFRQLRRIASPEPGELSYPVSRSQIQTFLNTLDRRGLLPAAGSVWHSDGQRVRRLAADMRFELDEIDELVDVLSSLAPVEEKLSHALEARREMLEAELSANLETEIKASLEARYETLSIENEKLDVELAERTAETVSLEKAVTELIERRDRVHREVRSLIANLANLVEANAGTLEGSASRLIQDIDKVLRGERSAKSIVGHQPPLSMLPPFDHNVAPTPWEKLNQELVAAASRHGFMPRDIETLDVLARSKEVVLLSSDIADDVLQCYSSVVAQGGFAVQSLDPSVIGYDDLWRSPALGTPSQLSRAWTSCVEDPSIARLVLLEGIERTPLDLWIRPLLATLRGEARPKNLLVFLSMRTATMDRDRNVADLADIVVPFKTQQPDPLSPHFVMSLLGNEDTPRWVDFEAKPKLDQAEVATLMSVNFGPSGKKRMTFALRASLAAMSTGIPDPEKAIRTLCENLDASPTDPADRIASLQLGREYLRTLSN